MIVHTLGHAFLFPVYNEQDEDKAFELLKAAFKNKIIPLLEEYFFDDWNKICLVLGDNQKEAALCFVNKQEDSYESLFGPNHGLNLYEDAKSLSSLRRLKVMILYGINLKLILPSIPRANGEHESEKHRYAI
ncbi:hypothetical protein [Photobacterium leiognathi]|uniref:hypothetical protein n=1 Tax=Photobacterium leiognathi TaxID=553611 RepID=UPI0034E39103